MKWFWAIVGLLAVTTAAWFAWSAMSAPKPSLAQGVSSLDSAQPLVSEASAPDATTQPEPSKPDVALVESSGAAVPAGTSNSASSEATTQAPVSTSTVDQWMKGLEELQAKANSAQEAASSSETTPSTSDQSAANAKPGTGGPKWGEVVPARKAEQPDGSILFDERFPLTGKGTADSPYIVTWEFLVSASETYQPRLGKTRLPERITVLDGHYVRVVGYVAFPILATSPTEMLSMRNMWDGCCIGVPPTPYDAIEVRLKEPATPQEKLMRFGSVEGKFSVDPYVKENWLLGLYVMDDAKVSEAKSAGL